MADVIIRGVTYSGIDTVSIPADGGGTETFMQPSGAISITDNGVVDVTDYASAVVSVSGGGGGPTASDAILLVTVPAGSVVTATKGNETLVPTLWVSAADSTLAKALFAISPAQFDSTTPWTVTALLNAGVSSTAIIVNLAAEYDIKMHPYLPASYQLVEYIEKTANAYIDTGLSLGSNDFEINFKTRTASNVSGNTERPLVSNWTSSANYWHFQYSNARNDWYIAQHYYLNTNMTGITDYTYKLTRTGGTWAYSVTTASGVETTSTARTGYNPTSNETSLKILARGDGAQLADGVGTRMYYVFVDVAGTTERKLYPCYRKADSVSGMFDNVYGVFYPSAGSGTFLVGSDVI